VKSGVQTEVKTFEQQKTLDTELVQKQQVRLDYDTLSENDSLHEEEEEKIM
jgi:hypothetical protein